MQAHNLDRQGCSYSCGSCTATSRPFSQQARLTVCKVVLALENCLVKVGNEALLIELHCTFHDLWACCSSGQTEPAVPPDTADRSVPPPVVQESGELGQARPRPPLQPAKNPGEAEPRETTADQGEDDGVVLYLQVCTAVARLSSLSTLPAAFQLGMAVPCEACELTADPELSLVCRLLRRPGLLAVAGAGAPHRPECSRA